MAKTALVSRYMRFLRQSIDMVDWGFRGDGRSTPRKHDDDHLWACREGHRKPYSMTRAMAAQHLSGTQTYYYISSRRPDTMLLTIDVDAQSDTWDVVEFLTHAGGPFAEQYVEQSTNGRGFHIYVRLRCPGTRFRFDAKLNVFENALGSLLAENNFASTVEVHGTHSLLEYAFHPPEVVASWLDDGQISLERGIWKHARRIDTPVGPKWRVPCAIGDRGKLAKLPRLDNGSPGKAPRTLEEAPVLLEWVILRIVGEADRIDDWDAAGYYGPTSIRSRPTGQKLLVSNQPVSQEAVLEPTDRQQSGESRCMHTGCVSQDDPGALVRSHATAFALARHLGRPPTLGELELFYVENGYSTGAPTASRRSRLRSVVTFVASVWNPNLNRVGYQSRDDELVAAVQNHVQPEHREDICYDRNIGDRELALLLYVVERGTFGRTRPAERIWTLPAQSVRAFADRLKAEGVEVGGWVNRKKVHGCQANPQFDGADPLLRSPPLGQRSGPRYRDEVSHRPEPSDVPQLRRVLPCLAAGRSPYQSQPP